MHADVSKRLANRVGIVGNGNSGCAPSLHIVGDDGNGLANEYRVRVSPFAFVVGTDGHVQAKGLCGDPVRLRDLLAVAGLDLLARRMDETAETYARERSQLGSMIHNEKVGA